MVSWHNDGVLSFSILTVFEISLLKWDISKISQMQEKGPWRVVWFVSTDLYGKLNVTFNGNTSFTVSWVDDLIKTYSCFSVEWWTRGNKAAHKSFYEDENNYEVIPLHGKVHTSLSCVNMRTTEDSHTWIDTAYYHDQYFVCLDERRFPI